ncbi:MAG: hypothetical protein NVS9B15_25170 [Acidobacteriaceae bacterium]
MTLTPETLTLFVGKESLTMNRLALLAILVLGVTSVASARSQRSTNSPGKSEKYGFIQKSNTVASSSSTNSYLRSAYRTAAPAPTFRFDPNFIERLNSRNSSTTYNRYLTQPAFNALDVPGARYNAPGLPVQFLHQESVAPTPRVQSFVAPTVRLSAAQPSVRIKPWTPAGRKRRIPGEIWRPDMDK